VMVVPVAVLGAGAGEYAGGLADQSAFHHSLPVWSRKLRIWAAMLPKRVGVPKMMAS